MKGPDWEMKLVGLCYMEVENSIVAVIISEASSSLFYQSLLKGMDTENYVQVMSGTCWLWRQLKMHKSSFCPACVPLWVLTHNTHTSTQTHNFHKLTFAHTNTHRYKAAYDMQFQKGHSKFVRKTSWLCWKEGPEEFLSPFLLFHWCCKHISPLQHLTWYSTLHSGIFFWGLVHLCFSQFLLSDRRLKLEVELLLNNCFNSLGENHIYNYL